MQTFGIVSCEHELHGRKESGDIIVLLVADILPNPFMNRYATTFQLDNGQGDSVDINDQIGAAVTFAMNGNLFGYLKIVLRGIIPVDQLHITLVIGAFGIYIHAIAQQSIHLFIGIV